MNITGVRATTLSPFAYHSLMVQGGTATLPEIISDTAMAFGTAATLGMGCASGVLPKKDYLRDWKALPWRTSVFLTENPKLLSPVIRRLNLDAEAGLKEKIRSVRDRGNLKDFFSTQEVPPGQIFEGAFIGENPFELSGQKELIIRIGLHRNGIVKLTPAEVEKVRLNSSTASFFGRELPVGRYLLYNLQLTEQMSVEKASEETRNWN